MALCIGTSGYQYRHWVVSGRYAGRWAAALRPWAEDLLGWSGTGRDAYAYFNNDLGGAAVRDAIGLLELLGRAPRAAELEATAPEGPG